MAGKAGGVWTLWNRLAGNLAPLVLACPLFVLAVMRILKVGPDFGVFGLTLGFFIVGWLATNFLGLWGNGKMRRVMEARFRSEHPDDDRPRFFVGFARPTFRGLLDPHEDVGFLVVGDDEVLFFGSENQVRMPWSVVSAVGTRRNIHSWLGLGGWICVEGVVGGQVVRLLVEPRERGTLIGNRGFRQVVLRALRGTLA